MKRFLAGVLSATLILSSVTMVTFADELNTGTEVVIEEATDLTEAETVQFTSEEEKVTETDANSESESEVTETEENAESTTETESETDTTTDSVEMLAESSDLTQGLEYHVADAYAFEYSDEDIREAIEAEYSSEELCPDAEEITLAETFETNDQVTAYLRTQMRNRVTNFSFQTPSAIDYKGCIAKAYSEDLSTSPKEGDYIRANFIGYYIGWSYGTNMPYTYTITFTYTSNANQEYQVDQKVASLVNELGLKSSKSQYEKIKAIHDYLVNNISYVNDGTYECHGTYAALIKKKCVCQGYAATFHRLCREAGINSRYIVGDSINHAWNIVRVNDSGKDEWYNMDVTWDDPLPDGQYSTQYFMKNDVEFTGHPRNSEFRTNAFEKAHPMALYSWGKTTTGIYKTNLDYTFTGINGERLSSHADTAAGKPKLLIFYGNTCKNSQNAIKTISTCLPVKYDRLDVYAIECSGGNESSVRNFAATYNPGGKVKFSYNGSSAAYAYKSLAGLKSTTLPYVVMIDESDTVRFVTSGAILGDDINILFMKYLVDDWNPYAPALKSISLDSTSVRLGRSKDKVETKQLTVTYTPYDCINLKKSVFTSSDESVATVDENGLITAVNAGQAVITATCSGLKATCKVTVVNYVDDVQIRDKRDNVLSGKSLKAYSGENIELNLVTNPTNANVLGGIKWTVSDSNLVNISKKEEGYTVVAEISPDITESKSVTIKAEADGKSSSFQMNIAPSLVKLNANGGQINGKAYDYYKVTPGAVFGDLPEPDVRSGYAFVGWKTNPAGNSGEYISAKTIVNGQWEIYAIWKKTEVEQMWARELGNYAFTGAAIKPVVKVYDGNVLLTEGTDYTLVYKNNKNVYQYEEGDAEFVDTKAPCVLVKGKKNYADSFPIYFTISPKSIDDSDVVISTDLLVKTETAKAQYIVPVLKWGKVALKNKTDFTLGYPDYVDGRSYKLPGLYRITITGNGNYTGERTVNMRITDKNAVSIKKAIVKNLVNYDYTGEEIKQNTSGDKPFALYFAGKALTEGKDYYTEYSNNREIGTATITVTGIGEFTGVRKLTFKINGRNIAKAVINQDALQAVNYTGQSITPKVTLTYKIDKYTTETLKQDIDYTIGYENNTNIGNALIVITGINKYSGTVKKKFRIAAYKINGQSDSRIKVTCSGAVDYCKSGAKPVVSVQYQTIKSNGATEWVTLTEGSDYTLKYANNTKVFEYGEGDEGFYEKNGKTKSPLVTVVGKKNFSGNTFSYYKIKQASLAKVATVAVTDITFNAKAGKWVSKVSVTDNAGKRLVAKTDYSQDVIYTYAANATMQDGSTRAKGTVLVKDDIPMPGTQINAAVTGAGNYSSAIADRLTTSRPYKILDVNKDIGKGITFKVSDKLYIGSGMNQETGIVITKADITFKTDIKHADFSDNDYEIVPGSYTKNRLTGVATVTLRGINEYGGTKTVSFRIKAKSIK